MVIVDSVNEFPPEFGKNYYHIDVNEVQIQSFHYKKKDNIILAIIPFILETAFLKGANIPFATA